MKRLVLIVVALQMILVAFADAKVETSAATLASCIAGKIKSVSIKRTNPHQFAQVIVRVEGVHAYEGDSIEVTFSGEESFGAYSLAAVIGRDAVVCKNGSLKIQ